MLTKPQFESLRQEVEEALSSIADKYNCEVHAGNIKYSNVSATMSLDFNAKGANEMGAEQNLFNTYCTKFGFKPEDYQTEVTMEGKSYRLIGFNLKARKNFCIIEKDGKQFVCSPEIIKPSLGRV